MGGDVVGVELGAGGVDRIGPVGVVRAGVDAVSVLVEAVGVVGGGQQIVVMPIVPARVGGDAVKDGGAVHEVPDIGFQPGEPILDGAQLGAGMVWGGVFGGHGVSVCGC